MKLQDSEDKIVVEFEGEKIKYTKAQWNDYENYMDDGQVLKLKEWEIDLIENHGVDIDEL